MRFRKLIPTILLILILAALSCQRTNNQQSGEIKAPELPADIPALVELLKEPQQVASNAITLKLSEFGAEAVPALIELFEASNEAQAHAVHTLVLIGEPSIDPLIEALKSQSSMIRYGAITTLGQIGKPAARATDGLQDLFTRTLKTEQIAIMHTLQKITTDQSCITMVKAALRVKDLRFDAFRTLADWGPDAAIVAAGVIEYLGDEEEQTRVEAILALAEFGPVPGVVDALAGALGDKAPRVREHAANALGKFGPASAVATMALAGALGDEEVEVRKAAAVAIGLMAPDSKDAIPALTQALLDENPQVRRDVALTLGKFGSWAGSALDSLTKLAEGDPMDYVKAAATEAISQINAG